MANLKMPKLGLLLLCFLYLAVFALTLYLILVGPIRKILAEETKFLPSRTSLADSSSLELLLCKLHGFKSEKTPGNGLNLACCINFPRFFTLFKSNSSRKWRKMNKEEELKKRWSEGFISGFKNIRVIRIFI